VWREHNFETAEDDEDGGEEDEDDDDDDEVPFSIARG